MVVSGRITRSSCKLCNHADRDQLEQGLKDGIIVPKQLDRDMEWREGTTDRHFRNHMGDFHMGSNSECVVCTHHLRSQFEEAYFNGGLTTEAIAEEIGCSETTVYHHLKHHLKPLVQKSAAPVIAIEAGKEMQTLRSNIERINGELNEILDDADRHDQQSVRNITTLHKEVRESLNLMSKIQERTKGEPS